MIQSQRRNSIARVTTARARRPRCLQVREMCYLKSDHADGESDVADWNSRRDGALGAIMTSAKIAVSELGKALLALLGHGIRYGIKVGVIVIRYLV